MMMNLRNQRNHTFLNETIVCLIVITNLGLFSTNLASRCTKTIKNNIFNTHIDIFHSAHTVCHNCTTRKRKSFILETTNIENQFIDYIFNQTNHRKLIFEHDCQYLQFVSVFLFNFVEYLHDLNQITNVQRGNSVF